MWAGSSVTLLLYLGVTLLIQRGIVWYLASAKYPREISANIAAQRKNRNRHDRRRGRRRERQR